MIDLLGKSKFHNLPPKNPTQTMYTRFMKKPGGALDTAFTKSKKEFDDTLNGAFDTVYSEFWEG